MVVSYVGYCDRISDTDYMVFLESERNMMKSISFDEKVIGKIQDKLKAIETVAINKIEPQNDWWLIYRTCQEIDQIIIQEGYIEGTGNSET